MDVKNFKSLRKTLGLTQVEMARLLNISHSAVTKYEGAKANPKGELNNKLDVIMGLIENDASRKAILSLLKQEGGIVALSGLIGMHIASSESRDVKTGTKVISNLISSENCLGVYSKPVIGTSTSAVVGATAAAGVTAITGGSVGLSLLGPLGLAGGAAYLLYKLLGNCFNDTPDPQVETIPEKKINSTGSSNVNIKYEDTSSSPKKKGAFRRKGVHRFKKSKDIILEDK